MIRAAKDGDAEAWQRIDERYRRTLALLMRGKIASPYRARFDTDDVVQSTMLSAYKELDSYHDRGKGSFQGWLVSILFDRLRSRRRRHAAARRNVALEKRVEKMGKSSHLPLPEVTLERAEEHAALTNGLAELPEEDLSLLAAHFFDGLSFAEIAARSGFSESTARRRVAGAIVVLRHGMSQAARHAANPDGDVSDPDGDVSDPGGDETKRGGVE
ncbi:MAG: sigma-70 family RNA polymerase sigma factor [bacterium]|nr:sigma-70 family RNA polymerase sigma factor [bacterium]